MMTFCGFARVQLIAAAGILHKFKLVRLAHEAANNLHHGSVSRLFLQV